ncbi:hypothetical protein OG897_40255 [Streptomyces sp. NBC_00237]|uniref:hypothetical protein n=1 Tax=Streptomyces sp. NBC_00237 TaxID=2975687 RepID=UPI002250D31B|nr:hypothetical protein [Streptomyces sp. NBC_00237]MCX5207626.1 hypothetical protein [Streptomyces sp. NBC_00237]
MTRPSLEAPMANPAPTYISPKQLKRLEELAAASQLRAALFPSPSPKTPPARRRSRQYPGGLPNPWWSARPRRRLQG